MVFSTTIGLRKIPFARLMVSLMTGIGLQWQLQVGILWLTLFFACSIFVIIDYSLLPISLKYRFAILSGSLISFTLIISGAVLVWINDVRHDDAWIGHHSKRSDLLMAVIEEPLIEKAN